MIQNKNEQENLKNTGEKLKNALIYGIMELSKDERQELLALWKGLQHEKLRTRRSATGSNHI